jgi:hypothetical protein
VIYSYNKSQRVAQLLKIIFGKERYTFRTDVLSIIRRISTLYTQQQAFVMLVLLLSAGETVNRTSMTNTYCCVYSVEILLMMDSTSVRKVYRSLPN